jgi:hypothetical protein
MKLAIVGSTALGRKYSREIIESAIDRYKPTAIVSGGATGIDSLAAQIGRERGLEVIEFRPERQGWEDSYSLVTGKPLKGFRTRNQEIADACDVLVRIAWDPKEQEQVTRKKATYGSGWTRDRAREQGTVVEEHVLTLEQDALGHG